MLLIFFFIVTLDGILAQQEKLEIEGAIRLGNSEGLPPDPGTIRWTGLNLQLWNGVTWTSLTTFPIASIIKDTVGNEYRTVIIGGQEWMAENLRTTKYADGQVIPNIIDNSIWANLVTGAWCWYNNNNGLEQPYGKLYNWYAISNPAGLCPAGWHVPTDIDWNGLVVYIDPASAGEPSSNIAGGKMKEPGVSRWQSPNNNATNESNFTALGAGTRGINGSFIDFGTRAGWWTSTAAISGTAYRREARNSSGIITRDFEPKSYGRSVRCVKN